MEVGVKVARGSFKEILEHVDQGEEIILTRRGAPVARITPIRQERPRVPDLHEFRATIQFCGDALSDHVIKARDEERA